MNIILDIRTLPRRTSWVSRSWLPLSRLLRRQTPFFFPFSSSSPHLVFLRAPCSAGPLVSPVFLMRLRGRGGASRECASTCPCAWASAAGRCIRQWCKRSENDTQQQAQSDGRPPCFLPDQRLLGFASAEPKRFPGGITRPLVAIRPPRFDLAATRDDPPGPRLFLCISSVFRKTGPALLCAGQMCPLFWTSTPLPCFQGSSSASPPPAAPSGPPSRPQVKKKKIATARLLLIRFLFSRQMEGTFLMLQWEVGI